MLLGFSAVRKASDEVKRSSLFPLSLLSRYTDAPVRTWKGPSQFRTDRLKEPSWMTDSYAFSPIST